ncbi:MAG: EAL domain-containing protein [Acidiferrobacter sp.]
MLPGRGKTQVAITGYKGRYSPIPRQRGIAHKKTAIPAMRRLTHRHNDGMTQTQDRPQPMQGTWEPIVNLETHAVIGGEMLHPAPRPTSATHWRAWYAQVGQLAAQTPHGWCTINLDSHQITDTRLIRALTGAMREAAHLDWHLEWTERGRNNLVEKAARAFVVLRDRLDVGLIIDDVGAGQDGLRRIALTAPDVIKIDRHLLVRAHTYKTARDIIEHIIHLGAAIGADSVLEGIETDTDLALARSLGVPLGQGYLWPGMQVFA